MANAQMVGKARIVAVLAAALLSVGNAHAVSVVFPGGTNSQVGSPAAVNSYAEVGDAGGVTNPQDVVGTDIDQITGDIGPYPGAATASFPVFDDTVDAFQFFFSGGQIEFVGVLHLSPTVTIDLPLSLFTSSNPAAPLTPDFGSPVGNPSWHIGFNNLAAGNYIIQATFDAFDPPFTIGISSPGAVGAPIPEPGTLALLGLGLAGLGFSQRRKPK